MVFFLSLTATTLIIVSWLTPTFALNDWTIPCLHGQCAYDFSEGGPFLGSLQLIGAPDSISDLTEAAGWVIIECQSNAMAQDIRLICTDDGETPGCDHLLANGAEGKIIRLPDHCGRVPFARVVKSWISSDQSLPPSLIDRPRGYLKRPLVHALSLDTDLSRIDTEKYGDISFSVQGMALSEGRNYACSPLVVEKRLLEGRSSAFRRTVASSIGPRFSDENSISFPIDVEQSLNLIDSSISCPAGAASLVVDVGAEAHMHVEISFDVTGSLSPFNITQFVLSADMNATINGSIHVQADVEGSFDTGRVPIFQLPPTLEANITVPGILTMGTSFEVLGEFSADFASALDLDVGLAYTAQSVHMVFPPGHGASTGTFRPSDSSLSISASSALNANVDMTAHIIPRLEFDIVANVKNTSASILLNFDAFATLDLQGDVPQTTGTVGCDGASASTMLPVQGCVDISTGLDVNVGADANFFGLFDAGTQLNLFNKTFDLFSGCFNASSSSSSRKRALDGSTLDRRDLACLAPYLLETTSLVKDVFIRASNQTARVALPPRLFAPFDARDELTWCSNSNSSNSSSSSQTSGAVAAAGGMPLGGARAGLLSGISMVTVIAALIVI